MPTTDELSSAQKMTLHRLEEQIAKVPAETILQYFRFAHLPDHLRAVSFGFTDMAATIVEHLPRNPERTVALRKLLESKDAAVRARLTPPVDEASPDPERTRARG